MAKVNKEKQDSQRSASSQVRDAFYNEVFQSIQLFLQKYSIPVEPSDDNKDVKQLIEDF